MSRSNVDIKWDGTSHPYKTTVSIDGQDISSRVKKLEFSIGCGENEWPTVILHCYLGSIELLGLADAKTRCESKGCLKDWIRPGDTELLPKDMVWSKDEVKKFDVGAISIQAEKITLLQNIVNNAGELLKRADDLGEDELRLEIARLFDQP